MSHTRHYIGKEIITIWTVMISLQRRYFAAMEPLSSTPESCQLCFGSLSSYYPSSSSHSSAISLTSASWPVIPRSSCLETSATSRLLRPVLVKSSRYIDWHRKCSRNIILSGYIKCRHSGLHWTLCCLCWEWLLHHMQRRYEVFYKTSTAKFLWAAQTG